MAAALAEVCALSALLVEFVFENFQRTRKTISLEMSYLLIKKRVILTNLMSLMTLLGHVYLSSTFKFFLSEASVYESGHTDQC